VRAFAPGRVNLIGEHTDYNGGLALPFAIAEGVTVQARTIDAGRIRVRALDLGEADEFAIVSPEHMPGWRAFARGVAAELSARGVAIPSAELQIRGDVPRGSGLSSSAALAVALGLALLVSSDIRGRDVYRTIIFISYPLMTVAVAIIWRWLFDERVGLINYVARSLDLVDRPIQFLNSFVWALPSVIVANIWQMLGFYMIILLTGLQNIPPNLYEAAAIDGANAPRRFWRVTLPLLKPSLFLCFVIGMLNSFTSFDLVYVMTGGGPGRATELLVTYIYKLGFSQTRFDYAASVTIVFFVLLVGITWAANRLSGGNAGAVEKD